MFDKLHPLRLSQTPASPATRTPPLRLAFALIQLLACTSIAAQAAPTAPVAPPQSTSSPGSQTTISSNPIQPTTAPKAIDRELQEGSRNGPQTASIEPLTEFQQLTLDSTGQRLPIFGASLFTSVPSTFAPVDSIPVPATYLLGPGDEIRLQLFGQVNQQSTLVIDRNGDILVPDLGPIHLAGISFTQLHATLKTHFDRVYRNYNLIASLGQLRSIPIFVVGAARRPGSYTVSSLSTLLNALFSSGGPLPRGSLRDIQLRRDGQPTLHFDLYDLLLHGDKSKDVPLEPGDVLFIPNVGPQIAISGSVANPALYEILPTTTARQAIELAGGETAVASGQQIRIERIQNHSQRTLADIDLTQLDPALADGDILEVGEILNRYRNAVTLRGNVTSPGRYVWKPGIRILDIVPTPQQLITRAYNQRSNALGTRPLGYVPAGSQTLQIRATEANVSSDSAVQNASTASSTTGGSSVGAAITSANGVFPPETDVILSAPDIDWNYAVIERLDARSLETSLIAFNPGRLYRQADQSQNLELLPGDVVTFFSTADLKVPSLQQTRFVRLEGEFVASGIYSVLPGETLRSLLTRAGGLTPEAYLYGSEFTRQSTRRVQQQRLNEFADSLSAQIAAHQAASNARAVSQADSASALASTQQASQTVERLRRLQPNGRIVLQLKPDSRGIAEIPDLSLEDGDRFIIPRIPATVAVEGQVYSANAFVFMSGKRTRDYLRETGGPDRSADKKRIFVLRADGSVFSRQYGDVAKAPIFPGDTVVVPPRLSYSSILRNVTDISNVIGQLGIGIAAINLLH